MKKLLLLIVLYSLCPCSFAQSWLQKSYPAAAGVDGAFSFALGNKIYVGGGIRSRQLWEYDPAAGSWTQKSNIPGVITDRSFAVGFAMNGKGYVGMGIDGPATGKKDFWEYNPANDQWSLRAPYPGGATDGFFCFVLNGKAYVGAGENAFNGVQYRDCYRFDPVMNTWTRLNDFPHDGIAFPFSFTAGNYGYIACGAEGNTPVCRMMKYDAAGDAWTQQADFPGSARLAGATLMHEGKAWCGLGMDDNTCYNSFYSYDPAANQWKPEADFPAAARSFPVAASTGSYVFTGLGWSAPGNTYSDWWMLGAATGTGTTRFIPAGMSAYPNPARGSLFIRTPDAAPVQVRLTDMAGRLVLEQQGMVDKQALDVRRIAPGDYLLEMTGPGTRSTLQQVVIR